MGSMDVRVKGGGNEDDTEFGEWSFTFIADGFNHDIFFIMDCLFRHGSLQEPSHSLICAALFIPSLMASCWINLIHFALLLTDR